MELNNLQSIIDLPITNDNYNECITSLNNIINKYKNISNDSITNVTPVLELAKILKPRYNYDKDTFNEDINSIKDNINNNIDCKLLSNDIISNDIENMDLLVDIPKSNCLKDTLDEDDLASNPILEINYENPHKYLYETEVRLHLIPFSNQLEEDIINNGISPRHTLIIAQKKERKKYIKKNEIIILLKKKLKEYLDLLNSKNLNLHDPFNNDTINKSYKGVKLKKDEFSIIIFSDIEYIQNKFKKELKNNNLNEMDTKICGFWSMYDKDVAYPHLLTNGYGSHLCDMNIMNFDLFYSFEKMCNISKVRKTLIKKNKCKINKFPVFDTMTPFTFNSTLLSDDKSITDEYTNEILTSLSSPNKIQSENIQYKNKNKKNLNKRISIGMGPLEERLDGYFRKRKTQSQSNETGIGKYKKQRIRRIRPTLVKDGVTHNYIAMFPFHYPVKNNNSILNDPFKDRKKIRIIPDLCSTNVDNPLELKNLPFLAAPTVRLTKEVEHLTRSVRKKSMKRKKKEVSLEDLLNQI